MTEEAAATPHGAGDRRASPYPTDRDPTDEAAFLTDRPVLALDLGASRIRTGVVRPDGAMIARADGRTPVAEGPEALLAACRDLLREALRSAPAADGSAVWALGISAPGPLDLARGRLSDPPNMGDRFRDVPLVQPLVDALGLPAAMERDTNVAALAEHAYGAARGVDDFLYLTVSTGLGGAIISEGRIFGGPDGVAGELGHLPIDADGPLCGCGARGHLEALSSGSGIARAAREALAAGEGGGGPLAESAASRGLDGLTARDVAEAEDAGDPLAARLMDRARASFAVAAVSLVDIFNPTLIVVGGSLGQAQGERLLAPARAEVARVGFRTAAARARIVAAELGDDVGLAGAVPLVAAAAARGALVAPTPSIDVRTRVAPSPAATAGI
jgi:glucokinase